MHTRHTRRSSTIATLFKDFQCLRKGAPAWLSRFSYAALIALVAASLAGCAALQPRGQTETRESWPDYESAHASIECIVPQQTRRKKLAVSGIDPFTNPAITILNYSDIVQRFAVSVTVRREELDPGILECLEAGKACTGYAIVLRSSKRERIGGFWADVLNFRRVTKSTGWTFNALILMVGDLVVYTLDDGQPRITSRRSRATRWGHSRRPCPHSCGIDIDTVQAGI